MNASLIAEEKTTIASLRKRARLCMEENPARAQILQTEAHAREQAVQTAEDAQKAASAPVAAPSSEAQPSK